MASREKIVFDRPMEDEGVCFCVGGRRGTEVRIVQPEEGLEEVEEEIKEENKSKGRKRSNFGKGETNEKIISDTSVPSEGGASAGGLKVEASTNMITKPAAIKESTAAAAAATVPKTEETAAEIGS